MVLAQGLASESATAKHTLGQIFVDASNGAEYVYCQDSGSGSSQYVAVSITPGFLTAALTKANADKNYLVGVPQIAVTASYYFWCKRKGAATVLTASAAASEALLYTTASAGRIGDTAASQTAIAGIQLTATAATAAASANTACILDYPKPFAAESTLDAAQSAATSAGVAASTADSKALSVATEGGASASTSAVASHKTSSAH